MVDHAEVLKMIRHLSKQAKKASVAKKQAA